jgi:uncharacterized protein YkwD
VVIVLSPQKIGIEQDVQKSALGSVLVESLLQYENFVVDIFGKAAEESTSFLTVAPRSDEFIELPYSVEDGEINISAERELLDLVNRERNKVGAQKLVMDDKIVAVARMHSFDMWRKGYFSHTSPEETTPYDRMRAGGVAFNYAGENLALARTVNLAHKGLMESPGHRRNILDPKFRRVGIGAVDGGIYGIMFTQNFVE